MGPLSDVVRADAMCDQRIAALEAEVERLRVESRMHYTAYRAAVRERDEADRRLAKSDRNVHADLRPRRCGAVR